MNAELSVTNSKSDTMEAVTDSEAPPSDRGTNPAFERGGLWMSSFHGDRYTQEDIYKVADHVKVGFEDIFSEPAALKTGDIGQVLSPSVKRIFSLVFVYTQSAIYYFLTILTGMFLGLSWGAIFGAVNYVVVWFVHPTLKLLFVLLRIVAMPTRASVRAFLDPLFQAMGQIFAFISAKFRLRIFGMEGGETSGYKGRGIRLTGANRHSYPQEWLGFV